MTPQQAIAILDRHEAWRLGADILQLEDSVVRQALNVLISHHVVYHAELPKLQTEISDEEIEKAAQQINLKYGASFAHGFIMAIKWYREQLKSRQ